MQRILYAFVILIAAGACKLQEQDNPLIIGTCRDGIKNQDEEGVDCGGICPACPVVLQPGQAAVSPCHDDLTRYTVSFNGKPTTISSTNMYYSEPSISYSNYYKFHVTMPNLSGEMEIWLSPDLEPKKDRIYNITTQPVSAGLKPGFAYISYENNREYDYYYSGNSGDRLYMSIKSNTVTFEFCDVNMFDDDGKNAGEIDGQFSYSFGPETACDGSVSENQLLLFDYASSFSTSAILYSAPKTGANYYEYRVNLSSYYSPNEYFYIRLSSDSKPTSDRVYTLGESTAASSPKAGEAYIAYCYDGTCLYTGKTGDKLNMTVLDDAILFKFCDVDLFYYSTNYTSVSGVLKYKL